MFLQVLFSCYHPLGDISFTRDLQDAESFKFPSTSHSNLQLRLQTCLVAIYIQNALQFGTTWAPGTNHTFFPVKRAEHACSRQQGIDFFFFFASKPCSHHNTLRDESQTHPWKQPFSFKGAQKLKLVGSVIWLIQMKHNWWCLMFLRQLLKANIKHHIQEQTLVITPDNFYENNWHLQDECKLHN